MLFATKNINGDLVTFDSEEKCKEFEKSIEEQIQKRDAFNKEKDDELESIKHDFYKLTEKINKYNEKYCGYSKSNKIFHSISDMFNYINEILNRY